MQSKKDGPIFSCLGKQIGATIFFSNVFATPLECESNREGEARHSLLDLWPVLKPRYDRSYDHNPKSQIVQLKNRKIIVIKMIQLIWITIVATIVTQLQHWPLIVGQEMKSQWPVL